MENFRPGSGREKKIRLHPTNPDRVVGTFRKEATPQFVKARHYLNKILVLLFKENIPKIASSKSHPHTIEVERKSQTKEHQTMSKWRNWLSKFPLLFPVALFKLVKLEDEWEKDPKFHEFLKRIFKIINIEENATFHDLRAPHNYTKDESGNPVYLDTIKPWEFDEGKKKLSFDEEALVAEIEKLPEHEKRSALIALKRILELWSEEQAGL